MLNLQNHENLKDQSTNSITQLMSISGPIAQLTFALSQNKSQLRISLNKQENEGNQQEKATMRHS
jgi:hypothetical protein